MSFIYKYIPPERKTYLSDSLLRFTPPSALNDPFECLPGITDELIEESLIQFEKNSNETPEHLKKLSRNERRIELRHYKKKIKTLKKNPTQLTDFFYKQATNKIDQNLGILSLSKRWNSSLMWSHYTESHQGLCIGFNKEHDFFKATNISATRGDFTIEPVIYSDKRPLITNRRPNKQESLDILYTKSIDWEYEQEIRVISVLKAATKTINIKPYKISLFQVPHEAIGEIIIGLRASDEIIKLATELAQKLSIPLYKAFISQQSFDLEREMINA